MQPTMNEGTHTMSTDMISPVEATPHALRPEPYAGWQRWNLDGMRDALNDALNTGTSMRQGIVPNDQAIGVMQTRVSEMRQRLTDALGVDGPEDARQAASALLPSIDRAEQLLNRMGAVASPDDVALLMQEYNGALDHVEQVLAGAGWD